jgi:predicted nuclease of predicted toxin-antitoxin system
MIAFLADENISPESADHLEALGYACHSLRREGLWRLSDSEIVAMAKREGRIILTHDLDFGEFTISQRAAKLASSSFG